ncbi:mitogen-activated protein kinase kinase kinase 1-like isoform X2 [Dermacentor silvarum]|nr:mitogen-activated protein kinase kinase kinase 1-like isoform X2 [Dermacentor silvarum]
MATQLERLQQVHPVSVRDIKEKLQALRKHTSAGALSTSHARRAPVCVRHFNDDTNADGKPAESRNIFQTEGTGASFATKRPSRKPSPPPTPVRPPEAPDPPRVAEEPEMTTRTTTPRHRSTTPNTRRSCGTSPPRRRSPSPSQHSSPALDCPPELAEAIRRRVLQVRRGVRLYLLYQPGPRSFLIAADQPDHRFKVVLGPQTCSCGKGPHCVHLLFVMLRVLRLTDTDARLFSKTLKEFEVDELLRGFTISRRRTSQQSEGPLTDDKSPDCPAKNLEDAIDGTSKTGSHDVEGDDASTCPICLLEMFEGESVITCDKGCGNQLHHHCASIWVLQCSRNGEPVVCPLCRCHWKDDRSSPPPITKKPLPPEDDDEMLVPPCPLHCLLRRASDVSPLPRPVGTPSCSVSNAPPLVMHFFGTEVAQCLMSSVWSEREAAVMEVEAQVTHALRLATSKPMCLEPWGGIEAVQAACCRVISHAIADPVYRVYVTALRCFKSMLVHSPCAILEDLHSLQNRVRDIVRAVLIKCAHGGNKRSRQLSLATLAELARGQAGALSVGSLTQYPAPNGLGADFLLDVVLSEGKLTPSWQGLLSQLLVLGRLVEEFPHLLTSPIAITGTVNAESLVAVDLAVRAVGHSHVTVVRQGRHLLVGLARLCGRCPTSVARIWNGVSALQGPQRAQLVRLVGAALQEARRSRLFLCATRSPSVERQQEEHLVREQLLHTKKNWAGKDDEEEECCNGQRPASVANSPSRSAAAFQLPPPTIDPALFGQLVQVDAPMSSSETKTTDKPLPEEKCNAPVPEKKLADSQHSSGRSSWSSATSSSENKVVVTTEATTGPAVPPQRAPRSRPNFLPLRRLACSLTSLGQGQLSSAQTTPGSAVTSPVSFSREIAALPAARASSKKGAVITQGPPIVSMRGCDSNTAHSAESATEDDTQDNEFIIFKSAPGLPISFGASKEGAKGSSYVEGQHWLRGPMLGAGAFSSCYQAMDRSTGTLMAVKQLPFCRSCQRDDKETAEIMGNIWNEIQMMARLEHPHVLPLLGATKHKDQYNVFLEWMAGGSVASLLERYGPFPEVTILRYTYQALSGLAYLHENHILHRDLKGANLLVDSTGQHLKIADFGSASRLQSKATLAGEFQGQLLGTIAFMAPEVLRGENYGRSCDIWSVGCVLIEMATNAHPWDNCNTLNHLALIYRISCAQSPPPVPKMLSLRTQHLALQCLRLRSEDRPPATDLLAHPAFKEAGLHSVQES